MVSHSTLMTNSVKSWEGAVEGTSSQNSSQWRGSAVPANIRSVDPLEYAPDLGEEDGRSTEEILLILDDK